VPTSEQSEAIGACGNGASAAEYSRSYFERMYRSSALHQRGDKPFLNRGLSRMLRRLSRPLRTGRIVPRVIHFGCGEGHLAKHCAPWSLSIASDVSEYATRRSHCLGVPAVCGSVENRCFRNGSFDLVTAIDVLEHISDPVVALRTIYDVLVPGGVAVVSVPNMGGLGYRLKGSGWSAFRDQTHRSLVDSDTWVEWCISVGFNIHIVGSDALWDPPYFRHEARFQRLIILLISNTLAFVRPLLPWRLGDNVIIVLKKKAC
jgi:SAM-dependent methyltransferase